MQLLGLEMFTTHADTQRLENKKWSTYHNYHTTLETILHWKTKPETNTKELHTECTSQPQANTNNSVTTVP